MTPKKRARFLEVLATGGSVKAAAAAIGISRQWAYLQRARDAELAAAWDEAADAGADVLEDAALARAVQGVAKPVYQGGEQVGTVTEYSDTLLIFLLKGRRPEKYREKYDVQQRLGGDVTVRVEYVNADEPVE